MVVTLLVASIWKKYSVPGLRPLTAALSEVLESPVAVGGLAGGGGAPAIRRAGRAVTEAHRGR